LLPLSDEQLVERVMTQYLPAANGAYSQAQVVDYRCGAWNLSDVCCCFTMNICVCQLHEIWF